MEKLSNFLKIFISFYLILLQVSVTLTKGQARIINGYSTRIEEAPYLVQIILDGELICGGTLVSHKHVVTAAHCVYRKKAKRLIVAAGISKLSSYGYRSKIEKVFIPRSYDTLNYHNDVAVLKLAKSLKGPRAKPTTLCKRAFKSGDPAKLFGWGRIREDINYYPNQLQTVDIEIFGKRNCTKIYREAGFKLTKTMFCAAGPGKDSCQGDSGGPVMVNGDFCGVVSWALGCAVDEFPGVNTNIRAVLPFIETAMKF